MSSCRATNGKSLKQERLEAALRLALDDLARVSGGVPDSVAPQMAGWASTLDVAAALLADRNASVSRECSRAAAQIRAVLG